MANAVFTTPVAENEPVRGYAPGSPERAALKKRYAQLYSREIEIPAVIGGRNVRTGRLGTNVCPHEHDHVLARYHVPRRKELLKAVEAAGKARAAWAAMPWEHRAAIFLKAADLLAGPWRDTLNAATMLCQSKNVFQAEIDAACELIDFWRFNAQYMEEIYAIQPESAPGMWNRVEYRPLDGFVLAVTPFNFTSIAGNLPTAPALMGNTVLWKPASTAVYPAHFLMQILKAAGLPDGVINLVPAAGADISRHVVGHPDFAGLHFTGSTATFNHLWKEIAGNLERYQRYPRIVGETGGKDFIFAHRSADVPALVTAMVRGAFEYQGQKCSAASRAYIPKSLWPRVEKGLKKEIARIAMGPPDDFRNFMNAVIDRSSYDKIMRAVRFAQKAPRARVVIGGNGSARTGWFIEPTVIKTTDPQFRTMVEELFGPVLTVYVYPDQAFEKALALCDQTSPYGLTGAIFAQDREALAQAERALAGSAGNFYLNDKPTGAVVGQQPFGGSRASGTNDKAGSVLNLLRWTSCRTIKETFVPPTDFGYPFMGAK